MYETAIAAEGAEGRSTSVWEFEGVGHREILQNKAFLRELKELLAHAMRGSSGTASAGGREARAPFHDKRQRPPLTDDDCSWSYALAQCSFNRHCRYQFQLGDLSLDESCRLWPPVKH